MKNAKRRPSSSEGGLSLHFSGRAWHRVRQEVEIEVVMGPSNYFNPLNSQLAAPAGQPTHATKLENQL